MIRTDRNPQLGRILALVLCVAVAVFFSVLLVHSHRASATSDHAGHCQVCALGHTAASTTTVVSLAIALQMLMLLQVGVPRRGSPRFADVPTTRPPPISL